MVNRAPLIASLAIIGGMAAASAVVWTQIPDTARLPIHWDINNVPNGYASKRVALLLSPVLALLLTLLFASLAFLRTRGRETVDSVAYRVGWIGAVLLLAAVHAIVILAARGVRMDIAGNTTFAVALLLVALGNFLGKVRANPWLGIRTPWARTSTYSWEKSNRLGGKLLVAVGLATLATIAIFGATSAVYVLLCGSAVAALVSVAASYRCWKPDPHRAIAP